MRSVKAGRIAHAFLLSGPHGVGKKSCAQLLAQAILCISENAPCGECPQCRQVAEGVHPDVHVIEPDGRSVKIDQIRELRRQIALKPFSGGRHIVIIHQADRMTTEAQNALLKSLEEPEGGTVFFLVTEQQGSMLQTIISRCRPVRLFPLSVEKCAEVLVGRGIEPGHARELAGWAQGSVGRAIEIDADGSYPALRKKVMESLDALGGGKAGVPKAVAVLGDVSKAAKNVLEIMEVAARDRMAAENGGEALTDAGKLHLDGRALLIGIMEMRRMLDGNVSFSGALEKMYLELAGASAEYMED